MWLRLLIVAAFAVAGVFGIQFPNQPKCTDDTVCDHLAFTTFSCCHLKAFVGGPIPTRVDMFDMTAQAPQGGLILATGLLEEGGEVAPVHLPWKIEIRRFEEGRDKVGAADGFGANFAGGKFLGHAYDERAADGSVVGGELHLEALLPPGDSLVGPEYDEGVLVLAGFLEGFDQPADSVVDCEHSLIILPLKGMEIGAVNEFPAHRATRKPTRLEYGKTIGAGDPLFLVSGILRFSFPRGIDVLGDVNLHAGVVLEVPLGGGKGAVDGPIADPEVKGFLFVLSVSAPNVFLGPLGVVVGRVSLGHDRLGSVRLDQLFLEVVDCFLYALVEERGLRLLRDLYEEISSSFE